MLLHGKRKRMRHVEKLIYKKLREKITDENPKKSLTLDEQLDRLATHGMIIIDKEKAKDILKRCINYIKWMKHYKIKYSSKIPLWAIVELIGDSVAFKVSIFRLRSWRS